MTVRVAINGFYCVGRKILYAMVDKWLIKRLKAVVVDNLGLVETNAHLLHYKN